MRYEDIGNALGYPKTRIYRCVQELTVLGVVETLTKHNGTRLERDWNENGTKKAVLNVCNIATYKTPKNVNGTGMEREWNENGTGMEHKRNDCETISEIKSQPNIAAYSEDETMNAAIEKWLSFKREKKQTYKPIGLKCMISRLANLSDGDGNKAMAIVEQSMSNNYSGLFPLKQDFPTHAEQQLRNEGIILQEGQMDVTKGGW